MSKHFYYFWFGLLGLGHITTCSAVSNPSPNTAPDTSKKSVAGLIDQPAWISLYQPNYFFPAYYTASPYDMAYQNKTPNMQKLNKLETNFQISFKVPLRHLTDNNILYGAYTQQSYWQLYNSSPFFRESDYAPELFLENKVDLPLSTFWQLKYVNIGVIHQSNGYGGELERAL